MTAVTASVTDFGREQTELRNRATVTLSASYSTNGEVITAAQVGLTKITAVRITEQPAGYTIEWDQTNLKFKAYWAGAVAAHTHAVAIDGGATSTENAHTHAIALDSGNSAAGSSHNHAFTGTAISADTFTVAHDATPESAVVYVSTKDFVFGYLNSDCSDDNVSDYATMAGGAKIPVWDNNGTPDAVSFAVYFDHDAADASKRLLINNTITASDILVRLTNGTVIRLTHDAGAAATGVALYFNDNGVDKTLNLNCIVPSAANITNNSIDTTVKGVAGICAGANTAEATHTHGAGSLADAASGAGSAHSHSFGNLTDTASASASAGSATALTEVTAGTDLHLTGIFTAEFLGIG